MIAMKALHLNSILHMPRPIIGLHPIIVSLNILLNTHQTSYMLSSDTAVQIGYCGLQEAAYFGASKSARPNSVR